MTVFGALTTAVTGLTAQAQALGNLSDNIANSQTTGFKRIESSFQSLVTQSNADVHSPGGVRSRPRYTNDQQGTVTQDQNPTHMALSGNGFFQVSTGTDGTSDVSFNNSALFTRSGDFEVDRYGYLRNSSNMFLNGWGIDSTGAVVRGAVAPVRIQQLIDNPTATSNINLSANLPLTPTKDAVLPAQDVTVVDANGVERTVSLQWRQQSQDKWRLSFSVPGSSIQPTAGTLTGVADQVIGTPLVAMPGQTASPQASTVTIGAVASGSAYSVTVNGQAYTYTAQSFDTASTVAAQLFSQINGGGSAPGALSIANNVITLNGATTGAAFTISGTGTSLSTATSTATTTAAAAGTSQVSTATIGAVVAGTNYTITVAGTAYTHLATVTDSPVSVAQALAALVGTAGGTLSSSIASSNTITFKEAAAAGAGFTMTASPVAGTTAAQMTTLTATGQTTTAQTQATTAALPQKNTITIGTGAAVALAAGQLYSVAINGTTYTYTTVAADTESTVATKIAAVIGTAGGTLTAAPTVAAGVLTLQGAANATAFTVASSPTPVAATKEEIFTTITGTTGDVGDVYTINFAATYGPPATPSTSVSYTTDGTESNINTVVERLAAKINSASNSPVTAAVNGAGLKFTAKTANSNSILTAISGSTTNGTMPAHLDLAFANGGYLNSMAATNVGTGNAIVAPSQTPGSPAYIEFQVDYGQGAQTIRLNVGNFGESSNGLTQFAGTSIDTYSKTQDGFTRGAFRNIAIQASGDVVANYDNGRARTLARIPVIQVDDPNAMDRTNGNAFVLTRAAGGIRADDPGANGAAGLVTSSLEGSNVDIAQEFTKLIVTQRAYSANTKIVTASDEMLQETLGMKR